MTWFVRNYANGADIGEPCPVPPEVNDLLAQRRTLEIADGFHFD